MDEGPLWSTSKVSMLHVLLLFFVLNAGSNITNSFSGQIVHKNLREKSNQYVAKSLYGGDAGSVFTGDIRHAGSIIPVNECIDAL